MDAKIKIKQGRTFLGIELGSTRIKACLVDSETFAPLATGTHSWENRFENGYWTYSLEDIHSGIRNCYADLARNVRKQYGETIVHIGAIGVSAMMHGYMAFDKEGRLLVPFRTWRNTTTQQASEELTKLLGFNIPQRWSISHLYQAVLNGEEHLSGLSHINTLAGYIHTQLTGRFEVGLGEASGIFPVENGQYNTLFIAKTEKLLSSKGLETSLSKLLPIPRNAGFKGATLTEEGALFLDPTGNLKAGVPVCPPEGDAGTGMVATNSIRPKTGNISAGTSVFSMLVLENPMKNYYPEIDIVTTPDGAYVAMVHCNNCCGELDAWVNLFAEFASLMQSDADKSKLYELLYTNAMSDSYKESGAVCYNFISAEPVVSAEAGHPMYLRKGNRKLTLGGFFRSQLYASIASLKMGMDILFDREKITATGFTAHGGLFKIKDVAQQIVADALKTKITAMKTASEGGAWGMALLAGFLEYSDKLTLSEYLSEKVFTHIESAVCLPDERGTADFEAFMADFRKGLSAQKAISDL